MCRGDDERDDAKSKPVAERPINGSGRNKGRTASGIYSIDDILRSICKVGKTKLY